MGGQAFCVLCALFLINLQQRAYLANVPSIPTLERLHDLEDAIPRRPLPSYSELPLNRVRLKARIALLHTNIERLA